MLKIAHLYAPSSGYIVKFSSKRKQGLTKMQKKKKKGVDCKQYDALQLPFLKVWFIKPYYHSYFKRFYDTFFLKIHFF